MTLSRSFILNFRHTTYTMTFKEKYPILILQFTLLDMPKPVWRQLAVKAGTSMRELHHIIQAVMPWQTYHLYDFSFTRSGAEVQIGDSDLWQGDMAVENDDRLHYIEDIFRDKGDKVIYTYDMGDNWQHEVKLIDVQHDPFQYPVLPCVLGAKGICPPEDSGGPYAFSEMMKILSDSNHPEYDDTNAMMAEWGWRLSAPTAKKLQNSLNKYKTVMWKQYMG